MFEPGTFAAAVENGLLKDIYKLEQENAALKSKVAEITSHNTGSPKCEQCEHFDLSQKVYTVECYSCKRYCGDLFTLRASA
jgi:hypothetical protein